MKRQAALLFRRLGPHKAHVSPGGGFASRFRVSRIVFMSLDVRLDVDCWYQAHGVPERLMFARPIMRRRASLDANQARWQLLKERQNTTPHELTANNNIAIRINVMNLNKSLRNIETDDRVHGRRQRTFAYLSLSGRVSAVGGGFVCPETSQASISIAALREAILALDFPLSSIIKRVKRPDSCISNI